MSKLAKALTAAAGNAAGESLYVEDVFSTYLYTGNGAAQSIDNGIALGDFGVGTSTQFNGTSDYFSKSGNMTGNTDSKTFTLSVWVKPEQTATYMNILGIDEQGYADSIDIGFGAYIQIAARENRSSTKTLDAYTGSTNPIPSGKWNHLLISFDMASSSNRKVYINDVDVTSSFSFDAYSNTALNFSPSGTVQIKAFANADAGSKFNGNVAHLFLDYTYRDLSVEANRRLFIDANGGSTSPSTLSALSPILYLPLTEDYSTGENLGTGGDFTANGSPTIVNSGTEYKSGYGEGGLVWIKARESANGGNRSHVLSDTERGATKSLFSDTTGAELTYSDIITAFNSNGFTSGGSVLTNYSAVDYASWTFRKAEKFFDVVTYTGNSTAGRTIPHNLGSVPACIIVKLTSGAGGWVVYHVGADASNPEQKYLQLNSTNAVADQAWPWNDTAPTDTEFTVGTGGSINNTGDTYVAYLFASDAGGFGDDGDENIIKCGGYTGNSSTNDIDLGFEPQWLLIKNASSASNWQIFDSMRGIVTGGNDQRLAPNNSDQEFSTNMVDLLATGFQLQNNTVVNNSGSTYIYIAIRRPMKTPASGTEVFAIDQPANTARSTDIAFFEAPFAPDAAIDRFAINGTFGQRFSNRLTGAKYIFTTASDAEASNVYHNYNTYMEGFYTNLGSAQGGDDIAYMFKRATGFFDVVAYSGTGVANTSINHNLGVVPEFIILKDRADSQSWVVYHKDIGNSSVCLLNLTSAAFDSNNFNDQTPTDSVFYLGGPNTFGNYTNPNIAYLFATLAGVSKVGSYTGTGADLNVDCGFSAGARFILIKRTDSTGDWYVYDSERGIVAGNDPYLLLNSTAAEVTSTDYIDPLNAGFTVTSSAPAALNASGGTYIFLAIA